MTGPVCWCGRPILDNAMLCQSCTGLLEQQLGDIRALVDELETTRTRQSRTGSGKAGSTARSADTPLPWDQRASETLTILTDTLSAWARTVVEERRLSGGPACSRPCRHASCWQLTRLRPPHPDPLSTSRFLLQHLDWLRRHEDAADVVDEIGHAVSRVGHVIDRRPDRRYAGPCLEPLDPDGEHAPGAAVERCSEELYAVRGAETVRCRGCGAVHSVQVREAWLLMEAEQQLATAATIAAAVTDLGQAVTSSMVRGWAFRRRLLAHGSDRDGRPLYRVGDVLDVLAEEAARRARAEARKADRQGHRRAS